MCMYVRISLLCVYMCTYVYAYACMHMCVGKCMCIEWTLPPSVEAAGTYLPECSTVHLLYLQLACAIEGQGN